MAGARLLWVLVGLGCLGCTDDDGAATTPDASSPGRSDAPGGGA